MKTLIQIVSQQTMPNLLAAMAVRPERIVHICTPVMKAASENLRRAYADAGLQVDVVERNVAAHSSMPEVYACVKEISKEFENVVVNFTGGTKLMSIGAYGAATSCKLASFYVDTQAGRFLEGMTGAGVKDVFPGGNMDIEQIGRQLRIHTIANANGIERVTAGQSWRKYANLARILLHDSKIEQACHDFVCNVINKAPRKYAEQKEWWRNWYSRPVDMPEEVCRAAVEAGLFEEEDGAFYAAREQARKLADLDLNRPQSTPAIFEAFESAIWPFTFFNGNWWEIAVIEFLERTGRYHDLAWSVYAGSRRDDSTDMEEDVLGVDGVNLLYVSCKRGGDKGKLSRVIEDVNSSAKRIGGEFAKKILAVYVPPAGRQRGRLVNRCRELGIRLLEAEEVRRGISAGAYSCGTSQD